MRTPAATPTADRPLAAPIYAGYAAHYDRQGQSQWGQALADFILDTLLPRYGREPRTALDLACGTGAVALALAGAGLRTIGLDRSAAMLALARQNARARGLPLPLVRADLRAFAFGRPFDLITCAFDSLNYLTDPADLTVALGRIRTALAPDGLFVGDLVTGRAYAADEDATFDLGDVRYAWSTSWDPATHLALTTIACTTVVGGRAATTVERHHQRAYERAEVVAALDGADLRLLDAFAARPFNEPALDAPGDETQRIIYVAERAADG